MIKVPEINGIVARFLGFQKTKYITSGGWIWMDSNKGSSHPPEVLVTRSAKIAIPIDLSQSDYANAAYRRRSRSWLEAKSFDIHLYGKLQALALDPPVRPDYPSRHTRCFNPRRPSVCFCDFGKSCRPRPLDKHSPLESGWSRDLRCGCVACRGPLRSKLGERFLRL